MAIKSLKSGSYGRSVKAGNSIILPGDFESIATITLGTAAIAVDFTSIPQTFSHLQVRFTIKSSSANNDFSIGANGSFSIANSSSHVLWGDGSSATASAWTSQSYVSLTNVGGHTSSFPSGSIGSGVIDVLDYTNTNKLKTLRSIWGSDRNGAGFVAFNSGMLNTTSAISALNFYNGYNWAAGTTFALYGIRG